LKFGADFSPVNFFQESGSDFLTFVSNFHDEDDVILQHNLIYTQTHTHTHKHEVYSQATGIRHPPTQMPTQNQ